jgi:salicylate hydroxylase
MSKRHETGTRRGTNAERAAGGADGADGMDRADGTARADVSAERAAPGTADSANGRRVTVVGGGVAGAATALALARTGARVTVLEAYRDPAGPVGSFLSLAANGLRGLDALGCLPAVQAAGFAVPRQRMWAGNGKLLGDVPRARASGDPLLSVTLRRADLVTVLREAATQAGARIVTGRAVTSADLGADQAAGPLADADLIVGADGIWSATRRALDPAAPEPAYAGLYSVSGTTIPAASATLGLAPGTWNMIYGRRGAFIYLPAPDGTVWWSAQVAASEPPDLRATSRAGLAACFGGEPQAAAIIADGAGPLSGTLHHVLGPVTRPHDDRVVLVGDAVHPVGAGQGASMAIEDAVVLAQQLRRPGPAGAALAEFARLRAARVGKLARTAAANRDAKTAGPVAAGLRNLFMPLLLRHFYERATAWLYDYDPGPLDPVRTGAAPGLRS